MKLQLTFSEKNVKRYASELQKLNAEERIKDSRYCGERD